MEDGTVVVGGIAIDGAKDLAGGDIVALLDVALGEVAIDGDVGAMTDEDIEEAIELEHSGYLAVEDGTGLGSWLALDIDAFVVERHIAKTCHIVLTIMAHYNIRGGDGHRQLTSVTGKVGR